MTKLEQATHLIETLRIAEFFVFMKQNVSTDEMLNRLEKTFILGKTDVDFYDQLKGLANLLLIEKLTEKNAPMNKPTILMTFAKNDLAGVKKEAENIYNSVQSNNLVSNVKIEDADIDTLAETIIDNNGNLFMFHYGGHADQNNIVLDGFRNLDKIRLSRLLLPEENHNLSIVFLNGCLTYGQVGLLTAKGVKVIIATNIEVNDGEAVRLSKFFYKCFFEKNYTLKNAFESAEATVKGKNSYPITVNAGEIDETQPMPSSWTLFVHSKYTEVLNWTLDNFVKKKSDNQNTPINTTKIDNSNFSIRQSFLLGSNIAKICWNKVMPSPVINNIISITQITLEDFDFSKSVIDKLNNFITQQIKIEELITKFPEIKDTFGLYIHTKYGDEKLNSFNIGFNIINICPMLEMASMQIEKIAPIVESQLSEIINLSNNLKLSSLKLQTALIEVRNGKIYNDDSFFITARKKVVEQANDYMKTL